VAVLLDSTSWTPMPDGARATAQANHEGSARLLRVSGWRVVEAAAGESLADVWPNAGRHHREVDLSRTAAGGVR
jgi:hypothetical protein